MLNDIRIHVHADEQEQQAVEKRIAVKIDQCYQYNIHAFEQYIPNVANILKTPSPSNLGVFVNQNGQVNIVDYGLGRTVYNLDVQAQVEQQLAVWQNRAVEFPFLHTSSAENLVNCEVSGSQSNDIVADSNAHVLMSNIAHQQVIKKQNKHDVLVLLGIGLGLHVLEMIKVSAAKHIILYEPEIAYLQASLYANDWHEVLSYAAEQDIHLYFQIQNDGSSLFQDLQQLQDSFACKDALIFSHYNLRRFDELMRLARSNDLAALAHVSFQLPVKSSIVGYTPPFSSSVDLAVYKACSKTQALFEANLTAFAQKYPDIHARMKTYEPQVWVPIYGPEQQINLCHKDNLVTWYGQNAHEESVLSYQNFAQHPNRDGLALGYRGDKNKHYLHNKFVIKSETLLRNAEDDEVSLPEQCKAIICFGLGLGYQLEQLVTEKEVEHLFICEPNMDFFYGSLFAIDWQAVFDRVEASQANLYLNIGDDGSNLLSDLMAHFYRIGPYVLNETYLFQCYYNEALNIVIADLREQLRLVISMSEHFDHALHGLSQTLHGIDFGLPILRAEPTKRVTKHLAETPVFIVGNGPSLDNSIEAIKEYAQNAIIVSCGTALQALHRHGITPDFHTEIEQYRSTFDWATRVDAPEYLKQITLLSCNGIHPDTVTLYKDVKVALKNGETSTRLVTDLLGKEHFELLDHAYPTVSNFALNLFLVAGFQQIYLHGVDLGFIDARHHHSKQSGYYDAQGKEVYSYSASHNTGILVPGNFQTQVFTKLEFNMARRTMENAIAVQAVEAYNTSNGALIKGTSPLHIDSLLVLSSEQDKQASLHAFRACFEAVDASAFQQQFQQRFSQTVLNDKVSSLLELANREFEERADIRHRIDDIRKYLFSTYQSQNSLFFYLFHGTLNFLNATLTKASMHQDEKSALVLASDIMQCWCSTLQDMQARLQRVNACFDTSSSLTAEREAILMRRYFSHRAFRLIGIDDSYSQQQAQIDIDYVVQQTDIGITIGLDIELDACNIVLADSLGEAQMQRLMQQFESLNKGEQSTQLLLVYTIGKHSAHEVCKYLGLTNISVMLSAPINTALNVDKMREGELPFWQSYRRLFDAVKHSLNIADYSVFVPKLEFSQSGVDNARNDKGDEFSSKSSQYIDEQVKPLLNIDYFFDFKSYIAVSRDIDDYALDAPATVLDATHSRGMYFGRAPYSHDLLGVWRGRERIV